MTNDVKINMADMRTVSVHTDTQTKPGPSADAPSGPGLCMWLQIRRPLNCGVSTVAPP